MSDIGTVLYDGECGFCARWVPFWETTLKYRGLAIAPLQDPEFRDVLRMSEAELAADIRLVLNPGTVIEGADVYRFAMRRIWWAFPLYVLSVAPGSKDVFNWAYRTFAANRMGFSRACGLDRRP